MCEPIYIFARTFHVQWHTYTPNLLLGVAPCALRGVPGTMILLATLLTEDGDEASAAFSAASSRCLAISISNSACFENSFAARRREPLALSNGISLTE